MRRNRTAQALALAFPISVSLVSSVSAQTQPAGQAQEATEPSVLSAVTVTGSREETLLLQTPASVGVISGDDLVRSGFGLRGKTASHWQGTSFRLHQGLSVLI